MVPRRNNYVLSISWRRCCLLFISSLALWSSFPRIHGTGGSNAFIVDARATSQQPLAFSSSRNTRRSTANMLLTTSKFVPRQVLQFPSTASRKSKTRTTSASTGLSMFMGSDGGILGIGTPELLTILLVGYFVLGPSDLYKLTKEIGKFVQNIRTLGSDLSKTVENNLESQLQLEDLRKAQRELNDAFSFRRSINNLNGNSGDEDEAFGLRAIEKDEEGAVATASAATAATSAAPVKKIRKRRVKKVVPEEGVALPNGGLSGPSSDISGIPDWEAPMVDQIVTGREAGSEWSPSGTGEWSPPSSDYTSLDVAEQRRFQAQLDVDAWNAQVMAKDQPQQQAQGQPYQTFVLTKIMERLALLDEEKNAADTLLQEEFRLRADTEEKYYREKRQILEDAVVELEQSDAYAEVGRKASSSTSITAMETATAGAAGSSNSNTSSSA